MNKKRKPSKMVWKLLSSKEPDSKVIGKIEERDLPQWEIRETEN